MSSDGDDSRGSGEGDGNRAGFGGAAVVMMMVVMIVVVVDEDLLALTGLFALSLSSLSCPSACATSTSMVRTGSVCGCVRVCVRCIYVY